MKKRVICMRLQVLATKIAGLERERGCVASLSSRIAALEHEHAMLCAGLADPTPRVPIAPSRDPQEERWVADQLATEKLRALALAVDGVRDSLPWTVRLAPQCYAEEAPLPTEEEWRKLYPAIVRAVSCAHGAAAPARKA